VYFKIKKNLRNKFYKFMEKKIILDGREVIYFLNKSKKARNLSISVDYDAKVKVTIPNRFYFYDYKVEKFLLEKSKWILKKIDYFKKRRFNFSLVQNQGVFSEDKLKALDFVSRRIEELNKFYKFKYKKVSVKNQKTRWGSCSRKGNLNFNYKILFLKSDLADYLIIHELCHLKEMNHSKRFWDLVAKSVSDYKIKRKELKNCAI
jgi:hypothetical protein